LQYSGQVFLGTGNGLDVKVFNQRIEHVWRDKRRESWAQAYVFNAQVKEGQQDSNRFLLVPGKNHGQRQLIYTAVKGIGQRCGNLDRGVGIVALPDVQEPGDAVDSAQFPEIILPGEGFFYKIACWYWSVLVAFSCFELYGGI